MSNSELHSSWLTVNRHCNLRCKWCYAAGTNYNVGEEMSLEFAITLINLIKDLGINRTVTISGETTLWKPLFDFNDYCKQNNIATVLVTNGLKFASDKFYEEYNQHPCDSIALSMKGANANQYHQLTGLQNFKLVKKAFTRIVNMGTNLVNITFNSCYQDILVEMAKFAADCGFTEIKIDFCTTTFSNGKANKTFMVHPRNLASQIVTNLPKMQKYINVHFEMNQPFCIWPPNFIKDLTSDAHFFLCLK